MGTYSLHILMTYVLCNVLSVKYEMQTLCICTCNITLYHYLFPEYPQCSSDDYDR